MEHAAHKEHPEALRGPAKGRHGRPHTHRKGPAAAKVAADSPAAEPMSGDNRSSRTMAPQAAALTGVPVPGAVVPLPRRDTSSEAATELFYPHGFASGVAQVLPDSAVSAATIAAMGGVVGDPAAMLADLIRHQVEYYFSDVNLVKDQFLRMQMDQGGWVPVGTICAFNRMQSLCPDPVTVAQALQTSEALEVANGLVRVREAWDQWVLPSAPAAHPPALVAAPAALDVDGAVPVDQAQLVPMAPLAYAAHPFGMATAWYHDVPGAIVLMPGVHPGEAIVAAGPGPMAGPELAAAAAGAAAAESGAGDVGDETADEGAEDGACARASPSAPSSDSELSVADTLKQSRVRRWSACRSSLPALTVECAPLVPSRALPAVRARPACSAGRTGPRALLLGRRRRRRAPGGPLGQRRRRVWTSGPLHPSLVAKG